MTDIPVVHLRPGQPVKFVSDDPDSDDRLYWVAYITDINAAGENIRVFLESERGVKREKKPDA